MSSSVAPRQERSQLPGHTAQLPLCVDLDGTLILSDLLLESFVLLIKRNPLYLLLSILWLVRGRAVLKAELASRITPNPASLPYNRELLHWLEAERSAGRHLWLCTASNHLLAERIATHLGLFQGVFASQSNLNLAGRTKAAVLVEEFGERGFDYCGNERRDIEIWKRASGAIVVHGSAELERAAAKYAQVLRVFSRERRTASAVFRALRPQQWIKNILVLVPLLTSHRILEPAATFNALLALVAFCLCASSVYVLNDMLDLETDRTHSRKSKRPFASGELSLALGFILAPCLLGSALLLATTLTRNFFSALLAYYVLTLAYSFALKKIALLDATILAGLYTLRIIAGAAAIDVPLSFWLLLFSIFLFLSLAFVKRFAELHALRRQQRLRAAGRGYDTEDLSILQSLGTAAGYLSVLVLALYINSPDVEHLYRRPQVIWVLCVLALYWISRVWMKARRGEMEDDPVMFAMKDRVSLTIGVLAAITVALAIGPV
jgi:4-hydroxybenzoate polyprenyltransferase/phosphoserine phosphatase